MNIESQAMTFESACPQAEQLEALLLGSLPSESIELLTQHIAACERCLTTIQGLGKDDTFAAAIRQSPLVCNSIPKGEVVDQIIERAKAIGTDPQAGSTSTVNLSLTSLGTQSEHSSHPTEEVYSFLRAPAAPGELGQLGPYRVLRVLGAGGMGVVFAALDPQLQRMIALKAIRPTLAERSADQQRFLREARAHAAVRHDHIVTVYQVGEDQGVSYLAMEYLEGETLDARLKRDPLPLRESVRIGREIALGLAAAHAKGVVHRDIKPGNIWLEAGTNRVKILDFGLARPHQDPATITQSGAVIGTPAFMSPEQVQSDAVDFRSDLFSLGCVLYRMATGAFPFQGKNIVRVLVAVTDKDPQQPSEINPRIPPALNQLILRLLAKKPADRPGSAAGVAKFLAELEQRRRPAAPIAKKAPPKAPALQPRRSSRPPRKLIVIAGLLAVLGLTAYFAKTVIRIATNTGELVIEVNDPAIEVVIKQPDGVVVVDGSLKRSFVLKATDGARGEVEFYEPDSGVRLRTQTFRLERGGVAVVTARIDRGPAQALQPALNSAPRLDADASSHGALAPITVDEPPPLKEWLAGRTLLTVAQDGSGQFKTIQAALDALKSGQAVQVLDKGPYREALRFKGPLANVGLVSHQRTILELPTWDIQTSEFAKIRYELRNGHQIENVQGFRLSGFALAATTDASKHPHGMLVFQRSSDVVVEDCGFSFADAEKPSHQTIQALVFTGVGADVNKYSVVRDCVIEGKLNVTCWVDEVAAPVLIARNLIRTWPGGSGILVQGWPRKVFLRNNVIVATPPSQGVQFLISPESKALETIEVVNNTVVGVGANLFHGTAPAASVSIRGNVLSAFLLADGAEKNRKPVDQWQVAGNLYSVRPESLPNSENVVFRRPDDPSVEPRFLSEDLADPNFARLTAVAGSEHAGALPPGPTPKDGDWFTRLRERWLDIAPKPSAITPPIQIAEPPPLDEWLKGRTILTVAQDGSGQFKSIQAALTAMQPGQVVKVLDKGPYRENLDLNVVPEDCGLISQQQTEITYTGIARPVGSGGIGHFFGPMEGLRIHGFLFSVPAKPEGNYGFLFRNPSGLLLEDCHFQVIGPDNKDTHVFVLEWPDHDAAKPAWIRNCVLRGRFSLLSIPPGSGFAVIEHNFIDGPGNQCIWSKGVFRSIIIRDNILGGNVGHADLAFEDVKTTESLELSNNTSLSPRLFVFAGYIPTEHVTIRNNLRTHAGMVGIFTDRGAKQVSDIWQVSHNAYSRDPRHGEFGYLEHVFFPRLPHDVVADPKFLATDAADPDFLRIPLDSPQATGGAGGDWPSYIGALAPGPAPKEGDWFTRLRERWPFALKVTTRSPIDQVDRTDLSIAATSRSQPSPSKAVHGLRPTLAEHR